jgi:hypothetical protein
MTDERVMDYDAGYLNDYGGGNVSWWHGYLRAEIERANEYWRDEYTAISEATAAKDLEIERLRRNERASVEIVHDATARAEQAEAGERVSRMRADAHLKHLGEMTIRAEKLEDRLEQAEEALEKARGQMAFTLEYLNRLRYSGGKPSPTELCAQWKALDRAARGK